MAKLIIGSFCWRWPINIVRQQQPSRHRSHSSFARTETFSVSLLSLLGHCLLLIMKTYLLVCRWDVVVPWLERLSQLTWSFSRSKGSPKSKHELLASPGYDIYLCMCLIYVYMNVIFTYIHINVHSCKYLYNHTIGQAGILSPPLGRSMGPHACLVTGQNWPG